MDLILNSTKYLKPGGVAIHTTEFNVSDDTETLESSDRSLYRRVDLINLQTRLIDCGCSVVPMNLYAGNLPGDQHVDLPPCAQTIHLKLQIAKYVVTSFGPVPRKDH